MQTNRAVVIGAGVGGLAAAIDLAVAGLDVTLVERAATPGGKLREVPIGTQALDAGPTVFTMRGIFQSLFEDAGDDLSRRLVLQPATVLARHAWTDGSQLDLHADLEQSAEAVGMFAGAAEARRFLAYSAHACAVYQTLQKSFIEAQRPNPISLTRRVGLSRLADLWRITPFHSLWTALGRHFRDPRLQQLFGRYATYCGSSPFAAPATLMLVSHVERDGVWFVEGGMHQLALAMADLASRCGVNLRYSTQAQAVTTRAGRVSGVTLEGGEQLPADLVICNGDAAAVSSGLLGADIARAVPAQPPSKRSLSAITWNLVATTDGFPLTHHNVFFSENYRAEFDDIFQHQRTPRMPTVYICAQDRHHGDGKVEPERLLCLTNAPANGDRSTLSDSEIMQCEKRMLALLGNCGLKLEYRPTDRMVTTPADFNRLFPGTGGALYGMASHGWTASFRRPASKTSIPGLYLAGGSTHPGPGLPMATLSGRLAAQRALADLSSTAKSRMAAMPGGTSTR
ncbi:1-hydroxycarotenoid 3,4-desaturase [Natronocella acetinitrilica]|uniref:1-hydroxycarotenoid 3,4-desaturase n=1 Tax=Natronocella acetinitrilica TaxID=414046 RepID=A0AAE3G6C2_9GAMM|nr:1-hydroxycarotenoid 3,4-desaturase CrtD [Natronocella acetinitrilica]MCP1675839.1 1-hydroxycarotenoid 3,4-desaturase [Natronocella acetinitrilica]